MVGSIQGGLRNPREGWYERGSKVTSQVCPESKTDGTDVVGKGGAAQLCHCLALVLTSDDTEAEGKWGIMFGQL